MVYSKKLVTVVKHNGNIIREDADIVRIPFGSEYSILMKNLSTQDCVVGVQIDSDDVLSSQKIIIRANTDHELLGFMDNNGMIKNRFKFIQKTEKIVNYRGDRIDDGIINITFQYVAQKPVITWASYQPPIKYGNYRGDSTGDFYGSSSGSLMAAASTYSCEVSNSIHQDEGITVKGSQVNQQYNTTHIDSLEPEINNIIIRLKGYTKKEIQQKVVYTNSKLTCSTCGKVCKSHMKFCPDCGTSLI